MNKQVIKEILLREKGNLEDDAYRYEHFGGTEGDLLVAAKRRKKIAEIDIALAEL